MAVFNSLTFDGQNSLDYGIYITGEAVYDAPEREVEMINVPGRNGALAIDQGRFQNISVEYKAGTFGADHSEYASKMRDFRNVLASRFNYKRITDSYHPDEFRLGLFRSGLEAAPTHYSSAGEFSITFDCKPQRYLTSGEEPIDFLPGGGVIDEHTVTGEVVTFEGDFATVITEVESDIEPVQDLHGYSKPWVGGAGKNKLHLVYTADSYTENGITWTVKDADTIHVQGTSTDTSYCSINANNWTAVFQTPTLAVGSWRLSCNNSNVRMRLGKGSGASFIVSNLTSGYTYSASESNMYCVGLFVNSGVTINADVHLQFESGTETTSWEPYTNICPISGSTEANIYVSPTTSTSDATVYNIDWTADAGTVYGGTLDVTTGVLTVTHGFAEYDGSDDENWTGGSPCYAIIPSDVYQSGSGRMEVVANEFLYSSSATSVGTIFLAAGSGQIFVYPPVADSLANFKTWLSSNPLQVVYPLATPLTYQLTATQIQALLGQNNVWADSGNVTVKYGTSPYVITNPTPFDAQPLLKVTGKGVLGIGDYIITITGSAGQVIYIDCDSMEIYKNTGGTITPASSLVSFNTNNFPKLPSGVSGISLGTGITEVEIIPRWWII